MFHQSNVANFKQDLNATQELLKRVRSLYSIEAKGAMDRLKALGSIFWKNVVRSDMFLYIESTEKAHTLFTAALNKLAYYEHLEHLALLELAAWKSECQKDMPVVGADFIRAQQWSTSGWKQLKAKHKASNAVAIIVLAVKPFLDGPTMY